MGSTWLGFNTRLYKIETEYIRRKFKQTKRTQIETKKGREFSAGVCAWTQEKEKQKREKLKKQ